MSRRRGVKERKGERRDRELERGWIEEGKGKVDKLFGRKEEEGKGVEEGWENG